jgi:hypothetical protein
MAGLVPAISVFAWRKQVVDARDKVCTQAGQAPDPGAGNDGRERS